MPGESDFIQVAFSNLGKNSSLSHLYDVSPPRLPIELPKVITVMIVMVIVPRILLKIADIYISISTGTFDIENTKYEKKWQQLDLDTNFEP